MVSKARLDLPDPLTPVMTVSFPSGISTLTFLRLCTRAPLTLMTSSAILNARRPAGLAMSATEPARQTNILASVRWVINFGEGISLRYAGILRVVVVEVNEPQCGKKCERNPSHPSG